LIIVIINLSCNGISNQSNKIACEKVQFHLNLIKEFLTGVNIDSGMRRMESIYFLERLTKIDGSGHFTFFGKYSVSIEDYEKWNTWFEKNRKYLYYDEKKKEVELIKH
jgi:hypothetical protein